jgi:hypothetical protein
MQLQHNEKNKSSSGGNGAAFKLANRLRTRFFGNLDEWELLMRVAASGRPNENDCVLKKSQQ